MANGTPTGARKCIGGSDWTCDFNAEPGDVYCEPCRDAHESYSMQLQEMRAETFAAESALGMRAGTTEGWYDGPEDSYDPMDPSTW